VFTATGFNNNSVSSCSSGSVTKVVAWNDTDRELRAGGEVWPMDGRREGGRGGGVGRREVTIELLWYRSCAPDDDPRCRDRDLELGDELPFCCDELMEVAVS